MENYNMIISGVIGSTITLLLTAVIDYLKDKHRDQMELKRLVFQRKTDAAEKAVSWLQECIDCYRMMQMACNEINEEYNPVVWERLIRTSAQASKLYEETRISLNPIYLHYDFCEIENKNHVMESGKYINYAITEIGRLDQRAQKMRSEGVAEDNEELQDLKNKAIQLFRNLSKSLDNQLNSMSEMIVFLRKEYQKFCY